MTPIWTARLAALALLLAVLPLGASAQEGAAQAAAAPARAAERARISQARAALQTEVQAKERACYQEFSVNACLSEVRAKRRSIGALISFRLKCMLEASPSS